MFRLPLRSILLGCLSANTAMAQHTLVDTEAGDNPIEEVIVTDSEHDNFSEPTKLTEKLLKVPGAFGDPMQAIFSLPVIVQSDEEGGEPAVRSSGPKDNAFLVDYLPAGPIFHSLLGNSIFNEDLLHDFGLHAAGFGSQYGKATGAIFDITLRQPRIQPLSVTLDASLLQIGLLTEGAITENQAFYLSYRESLIHLFLDEEKDEEGLTVTSKPGAKDYQAKYFWQPDEQNILSFLLLGSEDKAKQEVSEGSEEALLDPGGVGKQSLDTRFDSQGLTWSYTEDGEGKTEWKAALGHIRDQQKSALGPNSLWI